MKIQIAERFTKKIKKTDSCWLWIGATNEDGYGSFRMWPKTILAHRMAYSLFLGEIPAGLCVLHSCDQPACVRPDHLRVGTHDDNMADKVAKGRAHSPWSKLTPPEIRQMRKLFPEGHSNSVIGKLFGVSAPTVFNIRHKRMWGWVE